VGVCSLWAQTADAPRGRVRGRIAIAYHSAQLPVQASANARQAIELARRSGDDRLIAELSLALGLAELQQLELPEALNTWETGLVHARRVDDLSSAVACAQRMPVAHFILGELEQAERVVEESPELNQAAQNQGLESLGCAILALISVVRGDAEAVRRHAEEALSLHRRRGLPWTALLADAALACSFALRGDTVAANAAIDDIFVPGHVFDDPS